mmetsp:Transcript_66075/g.153466  ORF Transcript_66075/g.153466 Transcript_66075/m.153466 type:complete len:88 (+) Transcript_66075:238-501(+)
MPPRGFMGFCTLIGKVPHSVFKCALRPFSPPEPLTLRHMSSKGGHLCERFRALEAGGRIRTPAAGSGLALLDSSCRRPNNHTCQGST